MSATKLSFEIKEEQTVREFLGAFYVAKKVIHELYMGKGLVVNGTPVPPHTPLKVGDVLAISAPAEDIDFVPEFGRLDIVYEDRDLLIVNKPAGKLVHPDRKDGRGTLCNLVAGYYERSGQICRVRYIHRLDVQTSGGLIFAKHFLAHSLLDARLARKEIRRQYVAICKGYLAKDFGSISGYLARDRHVSGRYRVADSGDYALTHYQVLSRRDGFSVVELTLDTGRTHQIRVHLASLGHPLLGDTLYGGPRMGRHLLHSWKIQLEQPLTGEFLSFEVPIPEDMRQFLS